MPSYHPNDECLKNHTIPNEEEIEKQMIKPQKREYKPFKIQNDIIQNTEQEDEVTETMKTLLSDPCYEIHETKKKDKTPKLYSQEELDGLIRKLKLPKYQATFLASNLNKRNLLLQGIF